MNLNFTIFGNHPSLSLAELVTSYPEIKKPILGHNFAIFKQDWDAEIAMNLLGGTIKLGEIIQTFKLSEATPQAISEILSRGSEPRALDFGCTIYANSNKVRLKFKNYPIQIKKVLRSQGWSVRWVTGKGQEPLSPAAVAKCNLITKPNADLCLFISDEKMFVGRTQRVQNADAWSLRDYGRPFRNDKAGMLPPKLARIMVNLANVPNKGFILDPFCGSGTILMEAGLATKAKIIMGSDIDNRQVYDSIGNIEWLTKERIIHATEKDKFKIFTADVKELINHLPTKSVDCVITEGWLGPALKGGERTEDIQNNAKKISDLWIQTLKSLKPLLKKHARLVIIMPSFKSSKNIISLPAAQEFSTLGYKKINPIAEYNPETILYYERLGQHLRRNIYILENQ